MTRHRHQRGLAVVEFALTLPFLLFLMLVTVEVGRAFVQYTTLSNAVRNAVRHVAEYALSGTTGIVTIPAALQAQAQNLVVYGNPSGTGAPLLAGLTPAEVSVTNAGGGNVAVRVVHPYRSLLGGSIPSFGFGANLATTFTFNVSTTMKAL